MNKLETAFNKAVSVFRDFYKLCYGKRCKSEHWVMHLDEDGCGSKPHRLILQLRAAGYAREGYTKKRG